jgi:hypothetical protein
MKALKNLRTMVDSIINLCDYQSSNRGNKQMTAHLIELAKASLEAHKKYNYNANKVTFMSMTKPGRFAFE